MLIGYGFGAYRATGWIDVWYPPGWTRHVTAAAGAGPRSSASSRPISRGHIKRVAQASDAGRREALGARASASSNGDLGSIILFGSFLAWAVFDRISLKRRTDPGAPDSRARPAQRHHRGRGRHAALSRARLVFHPLVVGVPVFGRSAY